MDEKADQLLELRTKLALGEISEDEFKRLKAELFGEPVEISESVPEPLVRPQEKAQITPIAISSPLVELPSESAEPEPIDQPQILLENAAVAPPAPEASSEIVAATIPQNPPEPEPESLESGSPPTSKAPLEPLLPPVEDVAQVHSEEPKIKPVPVQNVPSERTLEEHVELEIAQEPPPEEVASTPPIKLESAPRHREEIRKPPENERIPTKKMPLAEDQSILFAAKKRNLKPAFITLAALSGIAALVIVLSPSKSHDPGPISPPAEIKVAKPDALRIEPPPPKPDLPRPPIDLGNPVAAKPGNPPPIISTDTPPPEKDETPDTRLYGDLSIKMLNMEGGEFLMGSDSSEADPDEKPIRRVSIRGFKMGKNEVTQRQWNAVMGNNPSFFIGEDNPVEQVSWNDIQVFLEKLNRVTGKKFRLPTEAEWEYACRAGTSDDRYGPPDDIGWHGNNADKTTHPVGQKAPNSFGLYDMIGNVWEWCSDWYGTYEAESSTNPMGPERGDRKVLRGGAWNTIVVNTRSAKRDSSELSMRANYLGFRLVLDVNQ